MIRNEQQYRISKSQASHFEKALQELQRRGTSDKKVHPILRNAEENALKVQHDELVREIEEYEVLKSGRLKVFEIDSFDNLPVGLIKARIAKGLSQKDLAEKLGMKEQQVQRYEATNYSTASFDRIKEVVDALDIKINKEIFISNGVFSKTVLFKNLKSIGLDSEIVLKRFLPFELAQKIEGLTEFSEEEAKSHVTRAASQIGRVISIDPKCLLGSRADLDLNLSAVRTARFKKLKSVNKEKISAYTFYAHTLALHVLHATKNLRTKKIPEAVEFRKSILKDHELNLRGILNSVWDFGIPVVPLRDSGSFHGACWRVDGRNVIVLKQRTLAEARWFYDLAHEVCHTRQHPDKPSLEIIEANSEAKEWLETEDEKEANYFAGTLVLGESADDLAEEAILSAKKDLVKLKSSVKMIAARENVDSGSLANYIAFRLQVEQGINWWGTAQNLQNVVSDPFEIVKEIFLERVNLDLLSEPDKQLLIRALI